MSFSWPFRPLPAAALFVAFLIALPWPLRGEGSAQLTPNNGGSTSGSNVTNTFVGYLQHEDGANSNSFLKPSTYGGFNEDHRLYVRLLDGESVYYGVRRIPTNESGNQQDLILTLRHGAGAGTIVARDTLARNTGSTRQSTLLAQPGVIGTPAEALAGPRVGGVPAGGYDPLSWTNNTGGPLDIYVEFTQVNEASLGSGRKSWYDLWDFTVIDSTGTTRPGRLFSKQWSFTAGGGANRLSATFSLYPLIPSEDDTTTYYVKEVELAGIRPWGFLFLCNSEGTTSGATAEERRRSQNSNTGYAEYDVFVQDPDSLLWPSAEINAQVVSATPYCNGLDEGNVLITYLASGAGEAELVLNLDGVPGFQAGGRDRRFQVTFPGPGYYNLNWNGLDGNGDPTVEGEAASLFFTLRGGVVHFPLWDVERNPDGFRIRDVRPDTGWAFLHWDDSNLPAAAFTPQTELDGVLSNVGVHDWGASADDGNNRLVNTWSFGQLAVDSFLLTLSYDCDFDGDGITNGADIDDDNDGITDSLEHGGVLPYGDHDGDTIANFQDVNFVHPLYGAYRDTNGDGVNDLFDADGDGLPNFRDVDADGDGLPDATEANAGVSPAGLNDSTGRIGGAVGANGMPDAIETGAESGVATYALTDTDGDGRPDFRDQDSDNDGITDNVELQATGSYVAPSGSDADGDGLDDAYDGNAGGSLPVPLDLDAAYPEADGVPDYLDDDTDGDGFPDWWEGFDDDGSGDALNDYLARAAAFEAAAGNPGIYTTADENGNGWVDWMDSVACGDAPEFLCPASARFADSDADGLIDLFDPDDRGVPSATPDFDGVNGVDFRDNGVGIPLPVRVLSFHGQAQEGQGIRLLWEVAEEWALEAYGVFRLSAEGRPERLAVLPALGTPDGRRTYTWLDPRPLAGTNTYGLVPRNADGSLEKALWAAVAWTPAEPLRAWPVPFGDRLTVALPDGAGARVLDATGTERWASAPGAARTLDLGTAEWPAGRYWLCPFARTGEPCTPLVKAR